MDSNWLTVGASTDEDANATSFWYFWGFRHATLNMCADEIHAAGSLEKLGPSPDSSKRANPHLVPPDVPQPPPPGGSLTFAGSA